MDDRVGTLADLNAQPGDQVEYVPTGKVTTITHVRYFGTGKNPDFPYCDEPSFSIVSRAADRGVTDNSKLVKALEDIYQNVDRWNSLQISSRIRAALHSIEAKPTEAQEPVAWQSVERKFYRSEWPLSKLLEARNGGLVTDEGEAWVYVYSHKDGTGGEYDLLRRREPATPSTDNAAQPVEVVRKVKSIEIMGQSTFDGETWTTTSYTTNNTALVEALSRYEPDYCDRMWNRSEMVVDPEGNYLLRDDVLAALSREAPPAVMVEETHTLQCTACGTLETFSSIEEVRGWWFTSDTGWRCTHADCALGGSN